MLAIVSKVNCYWLEVEKDSELDENWRLICTGPRNWVDWISISYPLQHVVLDLVDICD
jgi:hypothetical protein